uniref:8 kDa Amblyomma family member n=1 Tax=Rhipicephalus appendiculatus TaxID=34631 RepID=A0A131YGS5_RHIAP
MGRKSMNLYFFLFTAMVTTVLGDYNKWAKDPNYMSCAAICQLNTCPSGCAVNCTCFPTDKVGGKNGVCFDATRPLPKDLVESYQKGLTW